MAGRMWRNRDFLGLPTARLSVSRNMASLFLLLDLLFQYGKAREAPLKVDLKAQQMRLQTRTERELRKSPNGS